MDARTFFIQHRAKVLAYEARRYPIAAPMAKRWLLLAVDRAEKLGMARHAGALRAVALRIPGQDFSFADADGQATNLPMWAGEGEV
jgi:hypothetical protein